MICFNSLTPQVPRSKSSAESSVFRRAPHALSPSSSFRDHVALSVRGVYLAGNRKEETEIFPWRRITESCSHRIAHHIQARNKRNSLSDSNECCLVECTVDFVVCSGQALKDWYSMGKHLRRFSPRAGELLNWAKQRRRVKVSGPFDQGSKLELTVLVASLFECMWIF